jgi:hypothetical protein
MHGQILAQLIGRCPSQFLTDVTRQNGQHLVGDGDAQKQQAQVGDLPQFCFGSRRIDEGAHDLRID